VDDYPTKRTVLILINSRTGMVWDGFLQRDAFSEGS
jgi:hypothetical protein